MRRRSFLTFLVGAAGTDLWRRRDLGALDDAPRRQGAGPMTPQPVPPRSTTFTASDERLGRLRDLFRSTLEASQAQFRGQTGMIRCFRPGSSYPQVWVRDGASHLPLTRYLYPLEYLTSWLEEHLVYQQDDGQLYDWIAPGEPSLYAAAGAPQAVEVYRSREGGPEPAVVISADKNTNLADQETSAVDACYHVFKITGDRRWLNKRIKGKALVDRLDLALEYLLKHRFDSGHGLITSGFTTDFGDVSPVHADQMAIYLDEKTPAVVSLYNNALFYRAAEELSEIHQVLGHSDQAGHWKRTAQGIKRSINRHLWQEEKGFYRNHLVLKPQLTAGWPPDADIFALAGNALAAQYGIAGSSRAQRIFDVAQERRRKFRVSTIAGALLPPYPRGFFAHPAVDEEYEYLNGGQWDWWAGPLVVAEFEAGYASWARRQLLDIAARVVENNGLYEWYSREGKGRGSPNYAASAGALAAATFRGLFGVYLESDSLHLKVRLGEQPGEIRLYQPATDIYVAYKYSYDPARGIGMRYESTVSRSGSLRILIPEQRQPIELLSDGRHRSFEVERVGQDEYVSFATDWRPHRVELRLK